MILLDTHTLLWSLLDSTQLGPKARALVARAAERRDLALSAISYWEVAMLSSARKLRLRVELPELRGLILRTGVVEIAIDFEVASLAGRLTGMRGDPADRMVVATALAHRATLLTADHAILGLPGVRSIDARK